MKNKLFCIVACLLTSANSAVFAQNITEPYEPVGSRISLSPENEDFTGFDSIPTDNYKVYFTGEDHRYSLVNTQIEMKFVKFLHQKAGVRHLIIELGYSRGWVIDRYVRTGDTSLYSILKSNTYKDYLAFYDELKKYNDSLPEDQKIRVTGIDVERFTRLPIMFLEYLLPANKSIPKNLELTVESIKALSSYIENTSESYINGTSDNYFVFENRFQEFASTDSIITDFEAKREQFKDYLGDNYSDFNKVINSLKHQRIWNKYRYSNMIQEYIYREQYIYDRFMELLDEYPEDKFYGQFGRCHIGLSAQNGDCGWYEYLSIANRLDNSIDSRVNGKTLSIALYYIGQPVFDMGYGGNYTERYATELSPFYEKSIYDYTFFKVGTSDRTPNLTKRFDYLIICNMNKIDSPVDDDDGEDYLYRDYETYEFSYANTFYNFNLENLNSSLKDGGFKEFKSMIQSHGFHVSMSQRTFSNTFYFNNFVGQSQKDSMRISTLSLNGYSIGQMFGPNIIGRRNFQAGIRFGYAYNRMVLKSTNDTTRFSVPGFNKTSVEKFVNPAFVLTAAIDAKVFIGSFMFIGIYGGYNWDVSNKYWLHERKVMENSPKFGHEGWFAGVTVGLGSIYRYSYNRNRY